MHLDLTRLEGGRLRKVFRIVPGDPVLEGYEPEIEEPLCLDVVLAAPSPGTYLVSAELGGTVVEPCRRCLAPVAVEIRKHFRVIYREEASLDDEDPGEDDLVRLAPRATRIDIDGEVRDNLFLETDLYPLCDAACRGVCPVCGQNLNEAQCDCQPVTDDGRWSALRELGSQHS